MTSTGRFSLDNIYYAGFLFGYPDCRSSSRIGLTTLLNAYLMSIEVDLPEIISVRLGWVAKSSLGSTWNIDGTPGFLLGAR
jgi:hypothetical protein